jgi:hypothetical protein
MLLECDWNVGAALLSFPDPCLGLGPGSILLMSSDASIAHATAAARSRATAHAHRTAQVQELNRSDEARKKFRMG